MNFSDAAATKLPEEVSLEKTVIKSTCHNDITNKKKNITNEKNYKMCERITAAVNAVGGNVHEMKAVRKKRK